MTLNAEVSFDTFGKELSLLGVSLGNPSNFVVDNELFFFRVRHLKMKEKESIHSTQIFVDKWRHLARI